MTDLITVNIGNGLGLKKYFSDQGDNSLYKKSSNTIPEGYVCPQVIDKSNWNGCHPKCPGQYGDRFSIRQKDNSVYANRIDSKNNGWGMPLSFKCFKKEGLTVNIGNGSGLKKYFSDQGDNSLYKKSSNTIPEGYVCPQVIDKSNWNGCHPKCPGQYGDRFSIRQKDNSVYANRIDSKNNGWGMPLSFKCFKKEDEDLLKKCSMLQGELIESKKNAKIVASDRFSELKSQYLKKIELVDTQEELLNKQNKTIRNSDELIKKNKKTYEDNYSKASTYGRHMLYNKKDLNFYNICLNILKFILLAISVAVIYLLMKKTR